MNAADSAPAVPLALLRGLCCAPSEAAPLVLTGGEPAMRVLASASNPCAQVNV